MANNNHFELTLDTIAPTGSISRTAQFCKANQTLNITASGSPSHMKVWFNETAVGTKTDSGYTAGTWITYNTTYTSTFTSDGEYYYHLVLRDDVGNESEVYNTAKITFDTTKPTVSSYYVEDPDSESKIITNNLTNNIHFEFSDNLSGVVSGRLVCEDFASDVSLTLTNSPYSGQITFKEGTQDGEKTIEIYVKDAADNESVKVEAKITLDTTLDKPVLTLLKNQQTEESLPNYINYRQIKVKLNSSEDDIEGYKIWEGSTEPADYIRPISPATEIVFPIVLSHTLSDSDGEKVFHAKIIDKAGNEETADTKSVVLDRVAPTASISRSGAEFISNVSGFNTSEITFSCADERSGVKSYTVTCNNTTIDSGSSAQTNKKISISSSTLGMREGANNFKITVLDNADNEYVSTEAVINLDTTAPSGALPNLNTWYKEEFGINGVTYSDSGSGVHGLYIWSDTSSTATTQIPTGCREIDPKPNIIASEISFNLAQSASNYMHLVVKDNVGNVYAAQTKVFGYDNAPPTGNVQFSQSVYSSVSANITLSISDETSGQSQESPYAQFVKVTGDIANPDADFVALTSTRSVTLTTGDGQKTVNAVFKDAAGNISTSTYTTTCELDTTTPSGTLSLYDANTTSQKKSPSNINTADARITYSDDSLGEGYYKVWGDFIKFDTASRTGSGTALPATEDSATWIQISPTAGQKDFTLYLKCTTGDGQKNISVRLKDNAGHVYPAEGSAALTANFVYDTAGINVKAENPDFNRISKVNVQRIGATSGKMCDEIHFNFFADDGSGKPSSEVFQAYKVVAYADPAAAIAGSYLDNPIPTTGGSTNTSASGITQTGSVSVMIKGVDFESALNGGTPYTGTTHEFDGTHIITVYMQDAAGTWSEAAKFNA